MYDKQKRQMHQDQNVMSKATDQLAVYFEVSKSQEGFHVRVFE